jgi:hypothetical protein
MNYLYSWRNNLVTEGTILQAIAIALARLNSDIRPLRILDILILRDVVQMHPLGVEPDRGPPGADLTVLDWGAMGFGEYE